MKKYLLMALIAIATIPVFAQKRFTVSGTIKDAATGETLICATVRLKEIPQSGTTANNYGFYSLTAAQGNYSERNGYREPANNRLDLGATLEGKEHKKYHSSWTFSIYNVYAHWDPYTITFRDSKTVPNTTEAVETSLFPKPIPSVTWNFKF